MKLAEECMAGIGIDVGCRYFVEAIFSNNFRITDFTKHRGRGAYAFDTRKLDNSSFTMPLHIKLLSNMVHLGVLGMVCWDC